MTTSHRRVVSIQLARQHVFHFAFSFSCRQRVQHTPRVTDCPRHYWFAQRHTLPLPLNTQSSWFGIFTFTPRSSANVATAAGSFKNWVAARITSAWPLSRTSWASRPVLIPPTAPTRTQSPCACLTASAKWAWYSLP
ncbi:hypothetical protein C8Q77DRAFT_358195 [Trametes polyzona]|nr:hypothetical protein C8Q77DRAFT_358195 [Trametes polyzona]